MRSWLLLLGGLIVWAVHFFTLYIIAETIGASVSGRLAVFGVTAVCLLANGLLLRAAMRLPRVSDFEGWRRSTTLLGVGLSIIGVTWQMLPALLSSSE